MKVRRRDKEETITAFHVIFAVGTGGQIPIIPEYPNQVWSFASSTLELPANLDARRALKARLYIPLITSHQFHGKERLALSSGPRTLVKHLSANWESYLLTPNAAGHDVAFDMVEAGLSSVTMVQRGRTCALDFLMMKKGLSRTDIESFQMSFPSSTI